MRAKEFITEFETFDEMALPAKWDPKVFKYKPSDIKHDIREPFQKMDQYAKKQKAQHLGRGMERTVKLVKDPKTGKQVALKIAHTPGGVLQNKSDVAVLSNPRVKKLGMTIPLIDYDKKHKYPVWIQTAIAERVNDRYFKQTYGAGMYDIIGTLEDAEEVPQLLNYLLDGVKGEKQTKLIELIKKLRTLSKMGLDIADLHPGNWGLYNGQLVIIDAGFFKQYKVNEETLDEMPIPADWDPEQFGPKASFAKMIKYAQARAQKMGTGSSRVAFLIDYQGKPSILKIAKNAKGIAQNEAELNILTDGYAKHLDIMIPLIDYDNINRQPKWLHLELAQKATNKKLCTAMKCNSLDDLVDYAKFKYDNKVPRYYQYMYGGTNLDQGQIKTKYHQHFIDELKKAGKTEADIEIVEHYADELATLASLGVLLDDFKRPANWGFVNNKPVVIDLGFTVDVYPLYSGGKSFRQ